MKKIFKNYQKLAVIGIFLLLVFWGLVKPRLTGTTTPKLNIKKAKIVKVIRCDLEKDLILTGKIDASSYATLQFQTSGRLAWVGVKEGDRIKKWQAIASLDKTELEKRFKKAMNDYLTNRWNFEDTQDQYRSTKENFLVTDEIKRILERKQFSLENSVYDVEIADLALRYGTLTSPIKGILTSANQVNPGVNVTPLTASFTIVDPSTIYFKSEVDQEDVISIHEGQSVVVIIDSFPDQKIETKISYISFTPLEGQTSTVYRVKLDLPVNNKDLTYRIGMNGEAKIKLSEAKNILYLPLEAIGEKDGEKFVFLKDNKGKIIQKTIETGLETDDFIEIKEGLNEKDIVYYSG